MRSSLKSLGELETGLELEIRKVTAAEEEEAQRALGAVIGVQSMACTERRMKSVAPRKSTIARKRMGQVPEEHGAWLAVAAWL